LKESVKVSMTAISFAYIGFVVFLLLQNTPHSQLTFNQRVQNFVIDIGSLMLIIFVLVFVFFTVYGKSYLSSKVGTSRETGEQESAILKRLKQELEGWKREQDSAALLAGFSLTALVFILALEDIPASQITVEYFAIAFVMESIAYLSLRIMENRVYDYFGTWLQFAGLLSLINGFFIFTTQSIFDSYVITVVFVIGYCTFFFLSVMNMRVYISEMHEYRKRFSSGVMT
jgi:hypothetical protein